MKYTCDSANAIGQTRLRMLAVTEARGWRFLPIVLVEGRGYRGGSPTAVRPSDPVLCGSCPL